MSPTFEVSSQLSPANTARVAIKPMLPMTSSTITCNFAEKIAALNFRLNESSKTKIKWEDNFMALPEFKTFVAQVADEWGNCNYSPAMFLSELSDLVQHLLKSQISNADSLPYFAGILGAQRCGVDCNGPQHLDVLYPLRQSIKFAVQELWFNINYVVRTNQVLLVLL